MTKRTFSRRQVLATTAATTAALAMPYVRGAHAAGKVSVGFWDHWVPGSNGTMTALCQEWGEKNKVEVQIDYITSQGQKNLLTAAAEMQARSGHDILALPTWQPAPASACYATTMWGEPSPYPTSHGLVGPGVPPRTGACPAGTTPTCSLPPAASSPTNGPNARSPGRPLLPTS